MKSIQRIFVTAHAWIVVTSLFLSGCSTAHERMVAAGHAIAGKPAAVQREIVAQPIPQSKHNKSGVELATYLSTDDPIPSKTNKGLRRMPKRPGDQDVSVNISVKNSSGPKLIRLGNEDTDTAGEEILASIPGEKQNYFETAGNPKFKDPNYLPKGDPIFPFVAQADVYWRQYQVALDAKHPQSECDRIYAMHQRTAQLAVQMHEKTTSPKRK